jgi:anaerobic ribonucleoside-triphosphate reductase
MEEIPGEQACVSLLQKDKACGLILNDADIYLYSNQYIPLTAPVDMIDRIELSGKFMSIVSGGGIVHLNVGTQIDSDEKVYDILSLCAHHGVNHVAICYRFGKCKNGHTKIVGQATECPVCDAPIIKARNRVIGYYSDEDCWHPVRREHDAHERYFQNVEDENE